MDSSPTTPDQAVAAADSVAQPYIDPLQTFADFGVSEPIVAALTDIGITHPFPIQALTLPVALSGHDIIGQAKTGTGKTLGFGIPLLERVVGPKEEGWDKLPHPGHPQGLVIVPTRELAIQVAGDIEAAARRRKIRVLQVYGGRAYEPQVNALERGVEVVVGTPGRLKDLMKQRHLKLDAVASLVLDEADEMLDLGFLADVEAIIAATPPRRHTMLFSATMPGPVIAMARRYMTRPTHIRAQDAGGPDAATVNNVAQFAYRAHVLDKNEMLARILQAKDRGLTIVFTRTKRTAASVTEDLASRGFAAASIHGDLGQGAREQALRAFRHGKIDVLVATDVAARGIDVDDVTHVINYETPEDEKVYLHRIGRTARAGNAGTAVTFVDWNGLARWSLIDKAIGLNRGEPVETYSSSPHLYSDLNIPEGTKGKLPRAAQTRAGLKAEKLEDVGETGKRSSGGGRGGQDRSDQGRSGQGRDGQGRGGQGRGRSRGAGRGASQDQGKQEGVAEGASSKPRTPRKRNRRRKYAEGSKNNSSNS